MPDSKFRVVVAGLFHETNTFLEGRTELHDFEVRRGEDLLTVSGTGSPLAGVIEKSHELGWHVIPAIDLRAMPGPLVSDSVIHHFQERTKSIIKDAQKSILDGVLFVLHGAMVAEAFEDVEGEVLMRTRDLVGPEVPIFSVLDLHANFTARMASSGSAFLAYRQNPHTDGYQIGAKAVLFLDRIMREGKRPTTVWRQTPILWPPTGTGTNVEPMKGLEEMARLFEANYTNVLAVNVLAGFAFSDVSDAGVSFTCSLFGDVGPGIEHLDALYEYSWIHRAEGNVTERPVDEVVMQIRNTCSSSKGPILIVEPSDNIGAGTSGRGLGVLRAFLKFGIKDSAVVIQAPESVAALNLLQIGSKAQIQLVDPFEGHPLSLEVVLLSRSDGKFELEDKQSHLATMMGTIIDMGPCAVVRADGVRILLTSRRTPPFDLAQFRSQGITPEHLAAVGIKAAVAHQRAWEPIARGSHVVSTGGPCSSDLKSLNYRRLRRPVFPLDVVQ